MTPEQRRKLGRIVGGLVNIYSDLSSREEDKNSKWSELDSWMNEMGEPLPESIAPEPATPPLPMRTDVPARLEGQVDELAKRVVALDVLLQCSTDNAGTEHADLHKRINGVIGRIDDLDEPPPDNWITHSAGERKRLAERLTALEADVKRLSQVAHDKVEALGAQVCDSVDEMEARVTKALRDNELAAIRELPPNLHKRLNELAECIDNRRTALKAHLEMHREGRAPGANASNTARIEALEEGQEYAADQHARHKHRSNYTVQMLTNAALHACEGQEQNQ